ncbi:transcription initiation factor TFIID subunit 11 [Trifolium pratense]|uniref:Transcription initiation factor TFIID subunit 11 n=1 Tax=Trifolium pratense TaxID=57577 RepID=A0A2K3NFB6_TRIPR|nr:transcription initiation factor TFIID subunit 11 [Trifolium pratense]
MKQSKDPFESPPESPIQTDSDTEDPSSNSLISQLSNTRTTIITKNNKDEQEEEKDDMDIYFAMFPADVPPKIAKMHSIVSQFTDQQMRRYESFRRAKFTKAQMTRLVASINGTNTVPERISLAVSVITKMFVGEVVETARIIMEERRESGPIRPSHLREAHRRLKLDGKAFKRTVPRRLFRQEKSLIPVSGLSNYLE